MTETDPPPPEPPAPTSPERPRLLINGEPMRPEELGRMLSEATLRRLHDPKARPSTMIETLDLPPPPTEPGPEHPPRSPGPARPERSRGTWVWAVLGVLGLALALYLLLR